MKRAGDVVERNRTDAFPTKPVVLDEAQNRRLVRERVAHVVFLGPGRDHKQRQPWSVTAAGPWPISPASAQKVERCVRLVDDGRHHVVVPTVRVVKGDDHRHVAPLRELLEEVQDGNQEDLLVEGVGVTRVSILVGGCLEERDRREMAGARGPPEPAEIVEVIRLIGLADHGHRWRRQVEWVRSGGKVLKGVVMWHVVDEPQRVGNRVDSDRAVEGFERVAARTAAITCARESSLEPAPGHPGRGEQITDVSASHRGCAPLRADVPVGVGVIDEGAELAVGRGGRARGRYRGTALGDVPEDGV